MTVDDIAAEAGIGKGTVYLSFPSKEEVMLSTVDRIVERVCTAMEEAAARDEPAAERLRAMLRARILVRFEAVAAYSASLNDLLSRIRAALLMRRVQHFEREIGVLARVIAGGSRKASSRPALRGGSDARSSWRRIPFSPMRSARKSWATRDG